MAKKDELDYLLEQWDEVPTPNPRLTQHVWSRIAAEEAQNLFGLRAAFEQVGGFLSRPIGAGVFVAASIVCGLILAEMRVGNLKALKTEDLAKAYIHLIDNGPQISGEEAIQ